MKIAPSILSADFAHLGSQVAEVMKAGAYMIHVDVMDGHFVPNISLGAPVLKSLRAATDAFLDVHLMISQPERYVESFIMAGGDLINVHIEAEGDKQKLIDYIHQSGKQAGLTIKPDTPAEALFPFLDQLELVLVMGVEPGFGGQKFKPQALEKIAALRREIDRRGLKCQVEVDGGVSLENASEIHQAGADILVAGSAVFDGIDPGARMRAFTALE